MKWPQASLGDLCLLGPQYGANAPAIERSGNRSRYVRITDITANGRLLSKGEVEADLADETEFKLHEGDLLFARSGNTVGKTYCYDPDDGPCVFAGYLIRFRLNQELMHPRFAFYFTQSSPYQNWLLTKRRVAGQPNVNGKEYASLKVLLPSLSEQRRIVDLLEQADALRRRRADADIRGARTLPALFRKMFGDPIRNPKQWPLKRFDALGEARLGKMLDGNRQTGLHRRKYLRNLNLQWDRFELANLLEMDFFPEEREEFKLIRGDLLICEGGEVGRAAIWDEQLKECYFQKALHRVRPYKGEATSEFLLYWLWDMAKQQALISLNSKATIAHLTGVQLAALKTIAPPYPLMEQFTALVRISKTNSNKQKKSQETIETLFQTLLHRAFTGELTAGWREAHMKELLAEMEIQARHLASTSA